MGIIPHPQPQQLEWHTHAGCNQPGTDPDWWFPRRDGGPLTPTTVRALAICGTCPVWNECDRYVRSLRQAHVVVYGIWAGRFYPDRKNRHQPDPDSTQLFTNRKATP